MCVKYKTESCSIWWITSTHTPLLRCGCAGAVWASLSASRISRTPRSCRVSLRCASAGVRSGVSCSRSLCRTVDRCRVSLRCGCARGSSDRSVWWRSFRTEGSVSSSPPLMGSHAGRSRPFCTLLPHGAARSDPAVGFHIARLIPEETCPNSGLRSSWDIPQKRVNSTIRRALFYSSGWNQCLLIEVQRTEG